MLMVATSGTAVGRSGRDIREIAGPSLDGNPDGLSPTLGLDDLLLQAVEPDTAVNDLTYKFVLTYEDAAFGVFCGFGTPSRMGSHCLNLGENEITTA